MKLHITLFLILFSYVPIYSELDVKVAATSRQAIPLEIRYIAKDNDVEMQDVVHDMKRCFSFTKQFSVSIAPTLKLPTKKEVKALKATKTLLLVVVAPTKDGYEWHLYDTMSGAVLGANRCKRQGDIERSWAYALADQLWPLLTSQDGFFSTKLAYCKQLEKKQVKHIYIADFDGTHEQLIVDTPTINIAPRWNHDRYHPLVFYSDYTPTNVRLKMASLDKKSMIASDFDGLNMIPAFCEDGTKVVYCASRGDGSCQIYYCDKNTFKNITHNYGNNVSPSLSADGKLVFFCSDYELKTPQLYVHNIEKNSTERLTKGGYAVSPRYSSKTNKVAYAQRVDGIMQLFTYDVASKTHEQLTFDTFNKQEAAWSPCGNWLIYGIKQQGKKGRIAMLNRHSKEQVYLTKSDEDCSYPDWSPRYAQFPVVIS